MADEEKTEKATPKHRQDARKEGRVARSQDLSTGLLLLALIGAIKIFGEYMSGKMQMLLEKYLTMFGEFSRTFAEVNTAHIRIVEAYYVIAVTVGPILGASLIMGVAIQYAQVGIIQKKDLLTPKFNNLNPINGIKNMFNMKAFVELIKSILKFVIMAYVLYSEINKRMTEFPSLVNVEITDSILYLLDIVFSVGFKLGGVMLAIGVFDYLYQRWSYEKSLRMSKEEIKEEFKQSEGDPKIKGKIKQKQREIAMRRMVASVPGADVLITNPTHYAVALKYDDNENGAPVVVAKGADFVARKMKEKARECGVEMVENRPLAKALYDTVPVGIQIPPEFYRAVAEILAQIYKKKRRKVRR